MSATRILSMVILFLMAVPASAQDATGSIRGTVLDASNSRIAQASIVIVNTATAARYTRHHRRRGKVRPRTAPPGDYSARVVAQGMSPQVTPQLRVDIGAATNLEFHLAIAGAHENITVSAAPPWSKPNPQPYPRSSTSAPSKTCP